MALTKPRWRVGAQPAERCPICDASITWREARTTNTCGDWRCRWKYREQQEVLRHQQNRKFQQHYERRFAQAKKVRDARARVEDVDEPDSYIPVIVPVNQNRLVTLPLRRRNQFAKKLMRLVETALAEPSLELVADLCPDEDQSWALPILDMACAICEGRCCLKGGTHAHLDVATVWRYMKEHPEAGSRDILADYCRLLAPETYEKSCVFHTAAGCTLPRRRRSAACRNTVCSGLIELRDRTTRDGQTRFFISAMDKNGNVRSKFVECGLRCGRESGGQKSINRLVGVHK